MEYSYFNIKESFVQKFFYNEEFGEFFKQIAMIGHLFTLGQLKLKVAEVTKREPPILQRSP